MKVLKAVFTKSGDIMLQLELNGKIHFSFIENMPAQRMKDFLLENSDCIELDTDKEQTVITFIQK